MDVRKEGPKGVGKRLDQITPTRAHAPSPSLLLFTSRLIYNRDPSTLSLQLEVPFPRELQASTSLHFFILFLLLSATVCSCIIAREKFIDYIHKYSRHECSFSTNSN